MINKRKRPRSCISCRCESTKNDLLRVVKTPEGQVEVDTSGRKPGRGAYLCRKIECVENAQKKDTLSRVFKMRVDPQIYEQILSLLKSSETESGG